MRRWCDTVIVQDFPTTLWDGREVRGKNIIASIEGPEGTPANKRVLLAAHKIMCGKGGMKVTGINEIVREVLEVTGFTDILTIE